MDAPRVLHSDEHLLAVWKPPGTPVQPDRTGDPSLLDAARALAPEAGLVHRIDRPVSGVVLFSRTDHDLDACNRLFREQLVAKTYWAIVHDHVDAATTWTHRLMEDAHARKARIVQADEEQGQDATTAVRPLAHGERYTLIELSPQQGFFHQLRAQCAAAGHPIKGDVKYGARRGEKDRSIALHARSLAFVHPFTGIPIAIVAPPPETKLWGQLLALAGLAP